MSQPKLTIIRTKDYDEMSLRVAELIAEEIRNSDAPVLGLATGGTPVGAYQKLIEWNKAGELDFSGVTTVNLDEYKGLDGTDPQSYRYFMNTNLFDHVNIDKNRTNVPDGTIEDPEEACRKYDEIIASTGGVGLQLLGIGRNGHIAFNEPSDSFSKGTCCVALTESTIEANKRFFDSADQVPRYAYTMGIRSIMSADRIVIAASGADKAEAVSASFCGPITPRVPASVLQLHPDCILVADEAALSLL